ncbi:MAG: peptidyl-prolyl cis-trans isomerase [Planctomycetes bacterium]|nr:peptidyl-prolyl cis-trans isomerase [Planctomycetota bacterium]
MTHQTSLATALTLALLAACAAAPNPKPSNEPAPYRPTPEASPKAVRPATDTSGAAQNPAVSAPQVKTVEPIVAMVAGQPVYVSELLSQWLYLDNFRVLDQLRNLAMSRLVLAEASRLRVKIDAERSSQAYEAAVQAIESEIRASEYGRKSPKITLDGYVNGVMGLDPIRYRERLRDDALRALLGERVTRAWLLQQEHAEIHVIVVNNEAELKVVQDELAAGKPFEEVARARSADPSKKDGGAITPIVKGPTPLSKAAFETPIGALGGPITDSGAWLVLRVDARPAPLEGDWARIGPAIERSLEQRPVDPLEVKQWHAAMLGRYEVDLNPFLDLVNEPGR